LLDGRWGEAAATLKESVAGFERLHEDTHAATVRGILAELYDRIGNDEEAWQERMTALRELGLVTTTRLQIAISSMTRLALMKGQWQQAASFLRLELDVARVVSTPVRRIEMTLLRARLHERLGARDAAVQDLAEARAEIGKLDDPALSSLMEANAVTVEGALAGDPAEAIRLFTAAIESHQRRGRRMLLPEAFLLRGQAHAAHGDLRSAERDFDDGIATLEAGRETLPAGPGRLGFFHASDEIFEEAISLALHRGDAKAAFQYAERARARQLLDTLGVSWPSIEPGDIPADTAIVEYVSLAERLLIFVCDREGVRVREVPVRRTALEEQLRSPAANLHRTLIDPIAPSLATRPNLVIVPDRVLSTVPFAALRGSDGRYLMEQHTIRVSPSAAVYVRLNAPRGASRRGGKVLIVASSATSDAGLDPLPAAEREARRIALLYRNASLLNGAEATNRAFREAAPFADIIHFAGHATVGADRDTALVLTRAPGDSWRADARSIAALKLGRTSLVVLAGCNTARGKAMADEGTLSLARAFLAAGVPSVVATLQPIADDEAEKLFTRLHEKVAGGMEPAEALRAVQIEWSRRADVSAATWASIEVIGR
ncbi:MAG TPA: CHAT domain-containing protein, partial [Thermoanaerobaculia bacterium]|nr:CHAT domain-containing protein [Thermoanaerobaculia bacterium]